ncbi:MAG: DegV family protein [Oscillospiraceae bacterium]|nr:DegV family protein [Clostridia bacterium]MBP3698424.1 DegV family protein [Oscillospiraceae bacterium]
MNNYKIFTDSACDIVPELLAEWDVGCVSLAFRFDHIDRDYKNEEMPIGEFYQNMRDGHIAKTNAVNAESFRVIFEAELKEGNDILYIGFSSGLSTTYQQGKLAAEELSEAYPDRKIITIDTLCASAGEGLILKLVVDKKAQGATLEEAAAYCEALIPKLAHWFTVEDLVYLKRGGRVSPAVALVGSMLNIKPVMHVDDEGHLIKVGTVRGRKNSLAALADKLIETADDPANGTFFISHGDCAEDAQTLCEMIRARGGNQVQLITNVGTVIGAHSGPGTMALFFVAKQR